ncbi:MAG: hypothetical protein AAGE98_08310 [Actinomycetota bacterium]
MSVELTGLCREHSFESATALCRRCGLEFCANCVVFPFGEKKPLCKECAMTAAGVRSFVSRPAMNPKLVKKRAKAFASFATANNASAPMPDPILPDIVDPTIEQAEPAVAASTLVEEPLDVAFEGYQEPAAPGAAAPTAEPSDVGEGIAPTVDWNNPFG